MLRGSVVSCYTGVLAASRHSGRRRISSKLRFCAPLLPATFLTLGAGLRRVTTPKAKQLNCSYA